MGMGICPECGSSNVDKESGRWGFTGDWICHKCGYSNHPDAFKYPERNAKEEGDNTNTPQ